VQDLLEEEVTALLGREKSERCQEIDAMGGYRNGHGKPRRLSLSCGTVELRRPRVRGLEARFESRILPLFVRRSEEVGALLPELYLPIAPRPSGCATGHPSPPRTLGLAATDSFCRDRPALTCATSLSLARKLTQ
jgi:hypothetical protein